MATWRLEQPLMECAGVGYFVLRTDRRGMEFSPSHQVSRSLQVAAVMVPDMKLRIELDHRLIIAIMRKVEPHKLLQRAAGTF